MFYECLKLDIKNRNSVLNRVGKSAFLSQTGSGYEGPSCTSPPKDISSTPPPGLLGHVTFTNIYSEGFHLLQTAERGEGGRGSLTMWQVGYFGKS